MNIPALPMAIQAALANLLHAIMINVTPQPNNIGDPADNPEAGADAAALAEASAAHQIETAAVATAFAAAPAEPIITPTDKLGEWTVDDMLEAGHTLESLEADGYITVERPKPPAAPAPTGAAAGTQKAPAPPPPSTRAAPPNAQSDTAAPAGHAKILDAAGVPWDERIHSGSREQTTACLWKKRKGVDPALYASLTEELRAASVEPFTPLEKPTEAPAAPAAKAPPPPPPGAKTAPAPPPPKPAAAPSNYPASLEATTKDFATLCKYVMDKTLPSIPTEASLKVYEQFGVGTLGMVGKPEHVHLVDLVYQAFRELRGEA